MKLLIALIVSLFFCLVSAGVIVKREDNDEVDCKQMSHDITSFVKHYEKGLRQFAKKKATNDVTHNEDKAMENASKAANTLTSIMHTFQVTCQPTTRNRRKAAEEMETLYKGIHQSCKSLVLYDRNMNKHLPMIKTQNAELNSATDAIANRCLNPNAPRFYY